MALNASQTIDFYQQCRLLAEGNLSRDKVASLDVRFIRSQDGIAIYRGKGNGRILTALEAWDNLPSEIFAEILEYGSAIIAMHGEPANSLKKQRQELGLDEGALAKCAGVSEDTVRFAESGKKQVDIHSLSRICQVLNIDDYMLSACPIVAPSQLSVRLKKTWDGGCLHPRDIPVLSGCAWMAEREVKLRQWIGQDKTIHMEKCSNYGNPYHPAYKIGYELAKKTREQLGLKAGEPVPSMRNLCLRLGIPYVQAELSQGIAGLTLASGNVRSIVANIRGRNENPLLRRVTVAHELEHFLWDPDANLDNLNVDTYEDIESAPENFNLDLDNSKWVEQRANAFAVEFLLPAQEIPAKEPAESIGAYLRRLMIKYGVSFTSAKQHLRLNGVLSEMDMINLEEEMVETGSTDEWLGAEDATLDYFPIRDVPVERRQGFSYWVCNALKNGLISEDSAASFLNCKAADFKENIGTILGLFGNDIAE